MKKSEIQQLTDIAKANGFELYGSFNEGLQHDIWICTKGKYDGEVIDIWWVYDGGKIHTVDYSCQTKGQKPTFTFERFWDAQPILGKTA